MAFPAGFEHYDQQSGMFRHVCPMCFTTFYSRKRTGVTYCGATCRKRKSNGHKTFVKYMTCVHCGKQGHTSQPFQHKQYCSGACKQAAYRLRKASK